MSLRRQICLAAAFAGLCAAPVAARAEFIYKVVSIPLLPGASRGEATAVNNQGVVVGRCLIESTQTYSGFVFDSSLPASDTNPLDLGPLGPADEHGLWGVNDQGIIVGTRTNENGDANRALLITRDPDDGSLVYGDITVAPTPLVAASDAQARGINNLGTIAGIASFPCSPTQSAGIGCRWSPGGSFISKLLASNDICSPGAALAVNEGGELAGWALMNVGGETAPVFMARPFTCDDSGQVPLPTFSGGAEEGKAFSISNFGDVCGIAQDASDSGRIHPAVWLGGTIIKLRSVGGGYAEGSMALSINGADDIVGRSGSEDSGQAVVWYGAGENPSPLIEKADPSGHGAGYRLIAANAISDGGFIVGRGVGIAPGDASGRQVPFILMPCVPVVTRSPPSQTTCLRGRVALSVHAVGAVNPTTNALDYRWKFKDEFLENGSRPDGARISGANTRDLVVEDFGFANEGDYSVVISGSCGGITTSAAHVTVCLADLSCDGYVSDTDFPIFIRAYDLLDCSDPAMGFDCPADLNRDGLVDDADFVLFVQAYELLFCF